MSKMNSYQAWRWRIKGWPDGRDMKKWQGHLQMCLFRCALCKEDGSLFPLFSSRWQQATMQPDWIGDWFYKALVSVQKWHMLGTGSDRCGFFFLFFFPEWIIPLPYLSLDSPQYNGVYSGKPGWVGGVCVQCQRYTLTVWRWSKC